MSNEERKIVEFKTLSDDNAKGLSVRVSYLLKQGWSLSGTMQSTGENSGGLFSSSSVTYSQAMVLYEGDYKPLSPVEDLKFAEEIAKYNSGCMVIIIAGIGVLLHLFL